MSNFYNTTVQPITKTNVALEKITQLDCTLHSNLAPSHYYFFRNLKNNMLKRNFMKVDMLFEFSHLSRLDW